MTNEIRSFNELKYIIRFPDGFKEGERFPVLLFLHGAGTRGDDIGVLQGNVYFSHTAKHRDLPLITVAPQCNRNTWFDHFDTLKKLVLEIISWSFTDPDRIYLMGLSMGGYGAWALAESIPEHFAAMVPICGGGMYWNAERLVNIPIWAHHGALDRVVYPEESEKMVNAVNKAGGCARLTVYPDVEHPSWVPVYKNREVFEWLLSHRRTAGSIISSFTDGKRFG